MPPRAAVVLLLVLVSCPTRAHASTTVIYVPPVDAPITDGFRPPTTPYGPGNRGLEYATPVGSEVRASADGVVAFAGSVGGTRHVTLLHTDGLRTSYSFLAEVHVVRGQHLRRGDPVGTSTTRLHFGVRDPDDNYLDPGALFSDQSRPRARLVPGTEQGALPLASRERSALLEVLIDTGLAGWASDRVQALRLAAHYALALRPEVRLLRAAEAIERLRRQQANCTPVGEAPIRPPERRIAVLVGGLGSTGTDAAVDDVDTAGLGFAVGDVLRFSYREGRVPDVTDDDRFSSVPTSSYTGADTTGDLAMAADRLGDLLRAVAAAEPGVPIDVVAHSQGGVVARLAIAAAAAAGALPAEVSTLATIGAPHDGADLATAAGAVGRPIGPMPDAVIEALTGQDPSATSIGQLSEVSPFLDRLDEVQLPASVGRVSIAARGDVVVPVPRTMDPQFPSVVVGLTGASAHDQLPGADATTRELGLLISGRPPTCSATATVVADALWGEAASLATDALGAAGIAQGSISG